MFLKRQRFDEQAGAPLRAPTTSPFSTLFVCLCESVLVCWAAPIVRCEIQGSRVSGNRQRLWRCAASGGSCFWWWPERLFSWPTQLLWLRPPFVTADSGWVCFPLLPLPLFFSLCFSIDLEIERSECTGGWRMERGVYLGNGDLFVCIRAEYHSPFFIHYIAPPPTLSLLPIPEWGPIPLSEGPRAVAVTLSLAVKWGGPNLPQLRYSDPALTQTGNVAAVKQRPNKHIFTPSGRTCICLCHGFCLCEYKSPLNNSIVFGLLVLFSDHFHRIRVWMIDRCRTAGNSWQ